MARKQRKSISPRLRFEIFKRDAFVCQYCGRTPPDVVLEADHVVSVSTGGGNESTNLVTACVDCNRGKAAGSLSSILPAILDALEDRVQRAKQLDEYNRFLIERRKQADR